MTDISARLAAALAGRYRIIRELGAGGMATVHLAEDLRHARHVAIKVLRPELGAVIGAERFLQEIRTTAALSHPHILPLFDSGEADGLLYYVMPYVEGETLRARLKREHQLSVDEAVRIAREVADALHYAHEHHVIHRDIKPENILLAGGRPLVADFGIALAVSAAAGSRMTETGLSLGTPHYMSPEQATADREISGRSDIYSLASVLYEMLAGEPPHGGGTSQQVIARIVTETPRPVESLRRAVPSNVAAAIAQALEKLPADRFATGKDFADALGAPGFGTTLGTRASSATAARGRSAALPWAIAAVAVVIAAVAVARPGAQAGDTATPIRYNIEVSRSLLGYVGIGNILAIAPGGTAIALAGLEPNGARTLYLRRANDGVLRAIPGSTNARNPFFSRDGRWLAFFRGSQIFKAAVEGQEGVALVTDAGPGRTSWSRRDELVQSDGRVIVVRGLDDNAWRPVTTLDTAAGETAQLLPILLDDDETILYSSFSTGGPGNAKIGIASLSSGESTILPLQGAYALGILDDHLIFVTAAGAMMGAPLDRRNRRLTGSPVALGEQVQMEPTGEPFAALSAQGDLLAVSGSSLRQLAIAEPGAQPRALNVAAQNVRWPRLSPDGRRIAMTISQDGQTDIWVYTMPSGPLVKISDAGITNDRPEWTPDGRSLLYRSSRGPRNSLWLQGAYGGSARLLLADSVARIEEGVISSDGRWLLFQKDATGVADVWYKSIAPESTAHPVATSIHAEHGPRFSPDGRWLAYTSLESGVSQVYVRPFPSLDGRFQVSLDGGATPVWSRDGRALHYVVGSSVLRATLRTSPEFAVVSRDTLSAGAFSFTVIHADFDVFPDGRRVLGLVPTGLDTRLTMTHRWGLLVAERRAAAAR